MNSSITRNKPKQFVIELLLILLFNSLIAVFLFILTTKSFRINFIFSQSIGLSIFLISYALTLIQHLDKPNLKIFSITIPLGGIIGVIIASGFIEHDLLIEHPNLPFILLACTLLFGSTISYYFYARCTIAENNIALREASLKQLANEKQLTQTQLKLLQAQIEPHFLFNTLSNVLSLIDEQPSQAKMMLENFTQYLRASLKRTREEPTTLGDELELLRAYFEIYSIRMGKRLHYQIKTNNILNNIHLPPLILQPIVENAIKHGIAPKLEGGTIQIIASANSELLKISILDTGIGLQAEQGSGMGLNNVRMRLQALYGNRAKMKIQQNTPCGVQVTLIIPIEL